MKLKILNLTHCLLSCMLVLALPAQAQSFNILFTTPQEREYLDLLRKEFLARSAAANFDIDNLEPPPIIIEEVEVEVVPDPGVTYYHLGAIISPGEGEPTIWLNSTPYLNGELPDNVNLVNTDDGLALLIIAQGNEYLLKPGQSINTSSGSLQEDSRTQLPALEAQ